MVSGVRIVITFVWGREQKEVPEILVVFYFLILVLIIQVLLYENWAIIYDLCTDCVFYLKINKLCVKGGRDEENSNSN